MTILPEGRSLRTLRQDAKRLLRALNRGDQDAVRILKLHPKYARTPTETLATSHVALQDVQHAMALDYGFAHWTALRDAVSHGDGTDALDPIDPIDRYLRLEREVWDFYNAHWEGDKSVQVRVERAREKLPRSMAEAGQSDFDHLINALHLPQYFQPWVVWVVLAIERDKLPWPNIFFEDVNRDAIILPPDHPFPTAVRAHDAPAMRDLLEREPELANARVMGRFFGDRDIIPSPTEVVSGTALQYLTRARGRHDLLSLLLEYGADVDALGGMGEIPIGTALAVAAWDGEPEGMQVLLEAGADPNLSGPIFSAISHDAANEKVALLMAHGCELDVFSAAMLGDVATLERLINDDPTLLTRRGDNRLTPLEEAVAYKQTEAIRLLLDAGSERSWNVVLSLGLMQEIRAHLDNHGNDINLDRSLLIAIQGGQLEAARLLIEHGADVNRSESRLGLLFHVVKLDPDTHDINGFTRDLLAAGLTEDGIQQPYAIEWLASAGLLGALALLLESDNSRLNELSYFTGLTPLQALLRHPDVYARSHMTFRRAQQDPDVIQFLLDAGADPNIRAEDADQVQYGSKTALQVAEAERAPESVLRLLREYGAQ
ncbi:MAG: ankyrin repeat domain-containing protein [Pseudomonadota bacterium]